MTDATGPAQPENVSPDTVRPDSARPDAAQQHASIWAESFAQVIGQVSGSPIPCAVLAEVPAEMPAVTADDLWILCTSSQGLRGEMSLRLSSAATLRLAQWLMSETPTPDQAITPEHREAALELLRQVAGLVTSAVKPRFGEVQFHLESAAGAASWPASSTLWLRAGEGESAAAIIEIHLSAALVAGLRAEKEKEKTDSVKPAAAPAAAPANAAAAESSKLDLLMNVDLAVTLRFGSRRLLLREVLDLTAGAVIELDRQVAEPVDVLLDGRLVARGEVVVMDGNYGLRVTEIAPAGS
jgi:flagellar motor switch protein FliN